MLLPNAVLLPNMVLPLYIFEEKYRRMLAACLAGSRMFGVAKVRDGISEVRSPDDVASVAGVGLIRACVGQPDGTSTLVLHGLGRFRITRWDTSQGYWIGDIQLMESNAAEETADLEREILQRCAQLGSSVEDVLPPLKDYKPGHSDASLLADLLGAAVLISGNERQALLEEPSVRARLSMLLKKLGSPLK